MDDVGAPDGGRRQDSQTIAGLRRWTGFGHSLIWTPTTLEMGFRPSGLDIHKRRRIHGCPEARESLAIHGCPKSVGALVRSLDSHRPRDPRCAAASLWVSRRRSSSRTWIVATVQQRGCPTRARQHDGRPIDGCPKTDCGPTRWVSKNRLRAWVSKAGSKPVGCVGVRTRWVSKLGGATGTSRSVEFGRDPPRGAGRDLREEARGYAGGLCAVLAAAAADRVAVPQVSRYCLARDE